jgi:translation initiation factor 1A
LGKQKVLSEKDLYGMVLPSANDVPDVVQKMLGFNRVMVNREDGNERVCRIRGKMKRRTCIKEGKIVLGSPVTFRAKSAERYSGDTPRIRLTSSSREAY